MSKYKITGIILGGGGGGGGGSVNKNTDENEIYKNKIERERIDKSIKTQVNRHIHTKHTGKQLLYSH